MAKELHDTEVEVEILKTKEQEGHVQFLITEKDTITTHHISETTHDLEADTGEKEVVEMRSKWQRWRKGEEERRKG